MKGKILFEEEQSFVGTWMWYLTILIGGLSIFGTLASWMFSNNPEGPIGTFIASLVISGVVILLGTSKLHLIIDTQSIYYRYPPFVNKEKILRKDDIQEIYVRKYKPIWEYGGWGYRFRFRSGRAMTVSGNQGLQILTTKDKRLLIGTNKPDELQTAIARLKENWKQNG